MFSMRLTPNRFAFVIDHDTQLSKMKLLTRQIDMFGALKSWKDELTDATEQHYKAHLKVSSIVKNKKETSADVIAHAMQESERCLKHLNLNRIFQLKPIT